MVEGCQDGWMYSQESKNGTSNGKGLMEMERGQVIDQQGIIPADEFHFFRLLHSPSAYTRPYIYP